MLTSLSIIKNKFKKWGGNGREGAERPDFKTIKNYLKDRKKGACKERKGNCKSFKTRKLLKNKIILYCVAKPLSPTEEDLIEMWK